DLFMPVSEDGGTELHPEVTEYPDSDSIDAGSEQLEVMASACGMLLSGLADASGH
ncbi:hypothetical protein Tco_1287473, partial [Tanacetum coccineum]